MNTTMTAIETTTAEHHDHAHTPTRWAVIPTARRLGASEAYTGRGVTIAMLDSGFCRHPDIATPSDRIVALVDVTESQDPTEPGEGCDWMWHGTQTTVVAAGNGFLSNGLYAGLARKARLALVKVSDRGRISDADIGRGLEWVLENRERYGIRIVNMSLGGDVDASFASSEIDRAAERLVAAGVVVVVAAGNAGCGPNYTPIPPANSPSVITVGGYDDGNTIGGEIAPYCSNFGFTVDGILKPEVVAPAMWVAAPILPATESYRRAVALSAIDATPDVFLVDIPASVWRDAELPRDECADVAGVRRGVAEAILRHKIVATHYQHVDGTSFAAPIVASIVAQMLEANPHLTPAAVKNILISTADRIAGIPAERQGHGTINAGRAVALAASERHTLDAEEVRPPYCDGKGLVFRYHDDRAATVVLAGDFNDWSTEATPFERREDGIWQARVSGPAHGQYRYKLVIDGGRWIEDPSNAARVPDGLGGFNSLVSVG